MSELEEALENNFSDVKSAFKFFVNSGNTFGHYTGGNSDTIGFNNFRNAAKALISKRFSNNELLIMW